jgi:hypothetical protein
MKLWLHMLHIMLCEALSVRRDAHIRFLKIIYESKLKGNRIIPDPAERLRLLEAGAAVGHDVKDTLMVVELKTYIATLARMDLDPATLGMPATCIKTSMSAVQDGLHLLDIIVEAGVVSSRRGGREILEVGAIAINGRAVSESAKLMRTDLIRDRFLLVSRGKRNLHLVSIVTD